MKGWLPGILCLLLLPASGCIDSNRDQHEIRKTLATRTSALNSMDMTQYLSVVSINYDDKDKRFAQLKESLEKNFRDFEYIRYEPDTPAITVDGNHAESTGSYRMKIRARGKEMSLNGTDHLQLAKEPEGWKIIAGI